jgi:hypothetical protein
MWLDIYLPHEGRFETCRCRQTVQLEVQPNPLSLSVLEGNGFSISCPSRFTPGKESQYPLYMKAGGFWGRCGWVRKNSPTPGIEARTVQVVVNPCVDYAIPHV